MSEIAVRETSTEVAHLSINDLVVQVKTIQEAMGAVMHDGEHYGKIPGTGDKPTLLKPGAEKLCLLFRLAPSYDVEVVARDDRQIHYVVTCTLTHIPTGQVFGSGMGSCNSKEKKYRYRYLPTGETPPDKATQERLKATGEYKFQKIGGQWHWCQRAEADPWDFDNTILKMASKRALVAAVLNATAASDIFTQDVEDLPATKVDEPVRIPLSKEKVEQLTAIIDSCARLDPAIWSGATVLANASRRFGRQISSPEDLTEEEAEVIISGAQSWMRKQIEDSLKENQEKVAEQTEAEDAEVVEVTPEDIPFE